MLAKHSIRVGMRSGTLAHRQPRPIYWLAEVPNTFFQSVAGVRGDDVRFLLVQLPEITCQGTVCCLSRCSSNGMSERPGCVDRYAHQ